jgi:hypothetical protein
MYIEDENFRATPLLVVPATFNRSQRRKIQSEIDRVSQDCMKLEQMFLKQIFEDNGLSYKELYDHYLCRWEELIEWMYLNKWFKYTSIQSNYFTTYYYPYERNDN